MSLRHQSSDRARGAPSRAGCHRSDSFSLAVTVRQKWHNDMFIEKLWIIEKVAVAVGMSQPLTKNKPKNQNGQENSDLNVRRHARSSYKSGKGTHSNAQDKTVITVSTKLVFTWKNDRCTDGGGDRHRHSKSNKMFILTTRKLESKIKTFCTFLISPGAQSEGVFMLDWNVLAALQWLKWKVELLPKKKQDQSKDSVHLASPNIHLYISLPIHIHI